MSSNPETLRSLILEMKGDRSFERLSRDCGGIPKANRLNTLAAGQQINNFPDPPTIKGLSRGLNVSVTRVVLAAARSLDLNVSDSDPDELVLQGAGALPPESKQLLVSMSRQLLTAWDAADTAQNGVSDNDTMTRV
jgi:hypothetical protein